MSQINIPATIQNKKSEDGQFPEVEIAAYTGKEVDLSGYPYYIEHPVVYNVDGIKLKDKVPYLHNHYNLLGHTIKNSKEKGSIKTVALHSDPGEESRTVFQRIDNGIPYQASISLSKVGDSVEFIPEGVKVTVNNRSFTGPLFVINSSQLVEVSATLMGRDDDTEITVSNSKEVKDEFMTIKNSKLNPKEDKKDKEVVAPETKQIENSPPPQKEGVTMPVHNSVPSQDWLFEYIEYPALIKNARKEGWDQQKMDEEVSKIEADKLENSYAGVPGVHRIDSKDESLLTRMSLSFGVSPEFLAKKHGEKCVDTALKNGVVGLREGLMLCANSNGGRFNGFSDVENMAKFVTKLTIQNGFSTIDFPNLMHRIAQYRMEERWEMDEPQAPEMCKAIFSSDFRKSGHVKPKGGKVWESLGAQQKLSHGSLGKEDTYETELDTVGQILTFDRPMVINDDVGLINEIMDMMVEGAMVVPEYQLVRRIYEAENSGVLYTTGVKKSLYDLPLTETNLSTVYKAVRRRYTDKTTVDKDVKVNGRMNTRWSLVVSPDMEETAWNIIRQDRIVSNTASDTKQGDKNYWFNRLDIMVFDNLDNETFHASANSNVWMLLPQRDTYRPFYIRYLNQQTRPITELVDLPGDMLGFGVRGYWDVLVGYRPVEEDKLQAFALSIPGGS